MADEPKTSTDEVIDLEGFVRDIDLSVLAPTVVPEAATPVAPSEPVPAEPLHAEELSPEKIDEILMIEAPEMAAEMAAIREIGAEKNPNEIKPLEQEEPAVDAALHGHSQMNFRERLRFQLLRLTGFLKSAKETTIHAAFNLKGLLRELALRSKSAVVAAFSWLRAVVVSGLKWFKARTVVQKVSLFVSLLALVGLIFVSIRTLQGTLLPKTEQVWVGNFADVADGVFTYDSNGPFEDFNDPLLHPEFVILIERVVVNLSRTDDSPESSNPMAAFELYLQTDNQEAAVEIKDRSVEIKDALSRSVERMSYPDLAGEEGKAKLKLLIRRDLNEVLTKGKIRRVFFKTLVLNPE